MALEKTVRVFLHGILLITKVSIKLHWASGDGDFDDQIFKVCLEWQG